MMDPLRVNRWSAWALCTTLALGGCGGGGGGSSATATPVVTFVDGALSLDEGGAATLEIELQLPGTEPLTQSLTVDVQASGLASAGQDYDLAQQTVTFPAGASSGQRQTVALSAIVDGLIEGTETATLALLAPAGVRVGSQPNVLLTIRDADTASLAFAQDRSASLGEDGSHLVTVVLTASGVLAVPLDAAVTSADGTATAGSDYTAIASTVTFPTGAANGATQAVAVPLLDDVDLEGDETLTLTLSGVSPPGTLGTRTTHELTITEDDAASLSFVVGSSATVNEAAASQPVTVRLTTTGGTTLPIPVSVNVTSADATATAGQDYTAVSEVVTFPAGATDGATEVVDVPILGDGLLEGDETLTLTLTGPTTHGALGPTSTHTVTITDDETCVLSFETVSSTTGTEARGALPVLVGMRSSGVLAVDVSATVSSGGGTATAGTDYTALSAVITFPAGSSHNEAILVDLETLSDTTPEGDETVVLTLGAVTGPATLGSPSVHTVTITDDDGVVRFAAQRTVSADEAAGLCPVDLVLLTDGGTLGADVTVQVDSADGTATAGADYTAVTGLLVTFPAGSGDGTTRTVTVPILADALREGEETLTLTLSNVTGPGAIGGPATTTLRITDDERAWEPASSGLKGASCLAVVIDPTTDTLWASGADGYGHAAVRSTDGGSSWVPRGSGMDFPFIDLCLDPTDASKLAASYFGAVVRSTDGGLTWATVTPPGLESGGSALARDPFAPATLLAGQGSVIARTSNRGVTWSTRSLPERVSWCEALAFDESTPGLVYAATSRGVFKSLDGGRTWAWTGHHRETRHLLIDPMTPTTLYAAGQFGVFKSVDGGATWSSCLSDSVWCLAFAPGSVTTIYAGAGSGMYVSTDAGGTWTPLGTGLGPATAVRAIVGISATPSTLLAATTAGLARSTDSGATWSYVDAGLLDRPVWAIAVAASAPDTLYCAPSNGCARSTDGALSWSPADSGLPGTFVSALAVDPTDPARLYAGTTSGTYGSNDGGSTWALLSAIPVTPRALVIDPGDPSTLYSASASGVHVSSDSGATWQSINAGLGSTDVLTLAIDPATPSTLYAGTVDAGAYKTTNAGAFWTSINTGLTGTGAQLALAPGAPTTVYAATGGAAGDVFKSTDAGATWSVASSGLPGPHYGALAVAPSAPDTVYVWVSTSRELYRSTDGGATWSRANSGLENEFVVALAIDFGDPDVVYAATTGALFRTRTGGQ